MSDSAISHFTQGYASIVEGNCVFLGMPQSMIKTFKIPERNLPTGFQNLSSQNKILKKIISLILEDTFPAQYQDIVISKNNMVFSLCPDLSAYQWPTQKHGIQ